MAKTIQVVQAGTVVDVILADPAAHAVQGGARLEWSTDGIDAPDGCTFADVDGAQIGWVKSGSTLAPPAAPAQSFADMKATKLAAVNSKRNAIIAGGYTHNFGGTAGVRTLDQRDARDETAWLSVKLITADMIAADQGSTQIEIRDAGNETFRCSATTANAEMSAMRMWRSVISSASWAVKDAIEAAEH